MRACMNNDETILMTGMGAISAAGNGIAETLETFERGTRIAGQVSLFRTALPYPVFEVKQVPPEYALEGQRTLGLALIAVAQALKDARLVDPSEFRVGVCMGT